MTDLILDLDMAGAVKVDLAKTPHVLIGGATNSGKSNMLHLILLSLIGGRSASQLRLLLIDAKGSEFQYYSQLEHLYDPLKAPADAAPIRDKSHAANALIALTIVMDKRFEQIKQAQARDIEAYNANARLQELPEMPRIVVVIDEFADLILGAKKPFRTALQRLAQMGRAAGIHLIVATQRPSAEVLPGVIKANFAARIALKTQSGSDSRVILGNADAKNLTAPRQFICDGQGLGEQLHVSNERILEAVSGRRGVPAPYEPVVLPLKTASQQTYLGMLALLNSFPKDVMYFDFMKDWLGSSVKALDEVTYLTAKGFLVPYEEGRFGGGRWTIVHAKVEAELRKAGEHVCKHRRLS